MEAFGSTGSVRALREGVVVKEPWDGQTDIFIRNITRSFAVEKRILEFLSRTQESSGMYIGSHEDGVSLLLGETSWGCLQDYIDNYHAEIAPSLILKWQRQAVEAIAYVHSNGVIHSDMRLGNLLVDGSDVDPGGPNLRLFDFGGSCCKKLDVDGKGLPCPPFWNPLVGIEPVPALGIFGLGTVLYSIAVGRLPYRDKPGRSQERADREGYEADVEARFGRGEFPDLSTVLARDVVLGCWRESLRLRSMSL